MQCQQRELYRILVYMSHNKVDVYIIINTFLEIREILVENPDYFKTLTP